MEERIEIIPDIQSTVPTRSVRAGAAVADGALVREARRGDAGAFSTLVDRYRDAVYGVAYHYLSNRDDAQDAAQEAFVTAYLRLGQLRQPDRFGPWLCRITANTCIDLVRSRGARKTLSLDFLPETTDVHAVPSPEEDVERVPTRLVVQQALERLSAPARLALTLFYVSGYSQAEIARFLDVPRSTINSRLEHARRRLREEMRRMLADTLTDGKPGPEFTARAVEEALRRAQEARRSFATGAALRHYDEALAIVDRLEPGVEAKRLGIQALSEKGMVAGHLRRREESAALHQRALALAEDIGDRRGIADQLRALSQAEQEAARSEDLLRQACRIYEELDEPSERAHCLFSIASNELFRGDIRAALGSLEQAMGLFDSSGHGDYAAVCDAIRDLVEEVGEKNILAIPMWSVLCEVIEEENGVLTHRAQPGMVLIKNDLVPERLQHRCLFPDATPIQEFLDPTTPVGNGWSGTSVSFSLQPLLTTVSVRSRSARITVPAGNFENCLLLKYDTAESGQPDEAEEQRRQLNRRARCGTCLAWWAPGVGLVQLHVKPLEGLEAVIQLQDFHVEGHDESYFPTAAGSTWEYAWTNLPAGCTAREVLKLRSSSGNIHYLEHYSYVTQIGSESP
ncbi:MAG: sigma-70 family RNA polymerase sigma factor [Chloroflexi bacterium]|nr:sigma-70 family RNA polymerase sigma factor [Chloroflexota bacterium]